MLNTTPDPAQSTEVVAPLSAAMNLDELLDADGQIIGSPANEEVDE